MDENTHSIEIGKQEMEKFGYAVVSCQCLKIEKIVLMTAALRRMSKHTEKPSTFGYI